MKILLPSLLCALLFGSSASFRAQDDSDGRVQELETRLATLEAQQVELQAALEAVNKYLMAEAASAGRVLNQLQAVEAAGFTKGINYESRELLLAALRDFHGTLEKNVPGAKKPAVQRGR